MAGRAQKHRAEVLPQARQGPDPLVGVRALSLSHLGTQEVKPKVGRGWVTALETSFVGPRSVRSLPNALCRVQFYVPIGDIWPEETPLKPSLTQSVSS